MEKKSTHEHQGHEDTDVMLHQINEHKQIQMFLTLKKIYVVFQQRRTSYE